jgi:DNA-directed RNA polymerase specialized sigma24 family protein
MACAGRILVWWDRDFDSGGRPIRPDVRSAGRDLWEQACQQTLATLADHGPAAELMEKAVAQASRYLDRIGAPLSPRKHGLVMMAFRRALRRHAAKLARVELVGDPDELSWRASTTSWISQVDARLQLEGLVRRLSAKNADVLMLRAAGYEWKEIASIFGASVASVRNGFWREVEKLRWSSFSSSG